MLLSESNWRNFAAPVSVTPVSPFAELAWADIAGEEHYSGPVYRSLQIESCNLLAVSVAVQSR